MTTSAGFVTVGGFVGGSIFVAGVVAGGAIVAGGTVDGGAVAGFVVDGTGPDSVFAVSVVGAVAGFVETGPDSAIVDVGALVTDARVVGAGFPVDDAIGFVDGFAVSGPAPARGLPEMPERTEGLVIVALGVVVAVVPEAMGLVDLGSSSTAPVGSGGRGRSAAGVGGISIGVDFQTTDGVVGRSSVAFLRLDHTKSPTAAAAATTPPAISTRARERGGSSSLSLVLAVDVERGAVTFEGFAFAVTFDAEDVVDTGWSPVTGFATDTVFGGAVPAFVVDAVAGSAVIAAAAAPVDAVESDAGFDVDVVGISDDAVVVEVAIEPEGFVVAAVARPAVIAAAAVAAASVDAVESDAGFVVDVVAMSDDAVVVEAVVEAGVADFVAAVSAAVIDAAAVAVAAAWAEAVDAVASDAGFVVDVAVDPTPDPVAVLVLGAASVDAVDAAATPAAVVSGFEVATDAAPVSVLGVTAASVVAPDAGSLAIAYAPGFVVVLGTVTVAGEVVTDTVAPAASPDGFAGKTVNAGMPMNVLVGSGFSGLLSISVRIAAAAAIASAVFTIALGVRERRGGIAGSATTTSSGFALGRSAVGILIATLDSERSPFGGIVTLRASGDSPRSVRVRCASLPASGEVRTVSADAASANGFTGSEHSAIHPSSWPGTEPGWPASIVAASTPTASRSPRGVGCRPPRTTPRSIRRSAPVASIITVVGEIAPCASPAAWIRSRTESSSTISAPT